MDIASTAPKMPGKSPCNKTLPMLIVGLVMLMAGVAGGRYILPRSLFIVPSPTPVSQRVSPTPPQPNEALSILNVVSRKIEEGGFSVKSDPIKKIWWISDDNWSIFVPASGSFYVTTRPSADKSAGGRLSEIINKQMAASGLTLNQENSSANEADTKFYDYVQAYEKNEVKCVATRDPDDLGSGDGYYRLTFGCFDDTALQLAYNEQIPFLKGFNDRKMIIRSIEVKGNMAGASLHWRRTGASGFLYRTGVNDWRKIIITQAIPLCSVMRANNVPEQYWIDCYEGGTLLKAKQQ